MSEQLVNPDPTPPPETATNSATTLANIAARNNRQRRNLNTKHNGVSGYKP